MSKKMPKFKTDKELEEFLEKDLSEYITPENFKPVTFEFEPKEKVVNLRMSTALFDRIKNAAEKKKIPYQRYIRQTLETSVQG